MIQHTSPISGISVLPDTYVLTAGYDNQLILWDAMRRIALARGHHDHLVNQCAVSPCGRFAASASSDYSARLWRLPTLQLYSVMVGHEDDVEGIAFHPHKQVLATCSRDGKIGLFDFSGRLLHMLHGHAADVLSVAWLDDGSRLISSSDDGTIKWWNAATGTLIKDLDLGNIETDTIAIGQDNTVYAGNDAGEILVISAGGCCCISAHNAGIKRLIYDATQNVVVSLSYDRTLKIWRCRHGGLDCLHSAGFPTLVWPRSAAFLNARTLIFATFGSTYAEYDITAGRWQLDHIQDTRGYNAVCEMGGAIYTVGDSGVVYRHGQCVVRLPSLCNFLEPFAGTLITGGQSGEVFNALTGQCYHQHRSPVNCAATFTRHGQPKLLVGSYTGEGLVFGVDTAGHLVLEDKKAMHGNAIKGVAASRDAIFSVCADGAAVFHCPDSLALASYVANGHDKIANGCASTGDGRFVSVSRDLKLRLWLGDAATVIETPSVNSIKCVATGADGDMVAIGNYTGYVGIYRLSTATWLCWERPCTAGISNIKSCADGRFVFSSYDGMVRCLDPATGACRSVSVASYRTP